MLRYVSVAALLIVTCSAYARNGFRVATSNRGYDVKFTASNSTFLAIAQDLGIMESEIDAQFDSPLYGGGGGGAFNSLGGAVKQINIRSGSLIDAIQLVYQNGQSSGVYGGSGGAPASFVLGSGESVVAIAGRSGALVDSLTFYTNMGRIFGPLGGGGGSSFHVSQCDFQGIYGRSGSMLDAIGFHC
ncbi:hypothetical protein EMCRGX_G013507 [Ephydatia muelleri]|eukprot:Em0004g1131a